MTDKPASFTPGPWGIYQQSNGKYGVQCTYTKEGETAIFTVAENIPFLEWAERIAAAPDLYAALEKVLPHIERTSQSGRGDYGEEQIIPIVRQALAKAKPPRS